ncbi:S-adenosyl-L-methionine-dependentmethyltransferases superfamily protein [Striga asiatica]|uniref:S-adenosyl-L-methionine-dependentmethyltransferases superfamily protein n=1 Tax=Striga asiatica TaxID=4170 RepID=A0A5A7NXJ6_STRAF|nr:S-adenosyl-L-methionine-dependentmethyltransferases superfamily protein [Striga asiatica]
MVSTNGFAMNGGDGAESYQKNSSYQRSVINNAKSAVQKFIAQHSTDSLSSPTIAIADLGCSVGPNTLITVHNIVEAIKLKHPQKEFQVYFSDQVDNDFNTLFSSLPPDRDYHAVGVPGSFYQRLFPRSSLQIVHCSTALHWLSRSPSVENRGRIGYSRAGQAVVDAYARQHAQDVSKFLEARAEEVVPGGLLMLILPARPNGVPHSRVGQNVVVDALEDCLMDLARKGIIDEEKVDEFNCPTYYTSTQELEEIVKLNALFSIERMESLPPINNILHFRSFKQVSLTFRAAFEHLISTQFGQQISDKIFDTLLTRKLVKMTFRLLSASSLNLFVLLKRKQDDDIL